MDDDSLANAKRALSAKRVKKHRVIQPKDFAPAGEVHEKLSIVQKKNEVNL